LHFLNNLHLPREFSNIILDSHHLIVLAVATAIKSYPQRDKLLVLGGGYIFPEIIAVLEDFYVTEGQKSESGAETLVILVDSFRMFECIRW
jgi:hypothetical protein